jgi:hypothetical protein
MTVAGSWLARVQALANLVGFRARGPFVRIYREERTIEALRGSFSPALRGAANVKGLMHRGEESSLPGLCSI